MSRLLFGAVFVLLVTVSSTLEAQVSRHDQLMQDHRNRVKAMRERSRSHMESMMNSDPLQRHRKLIQASQARFEAQRKEFDSHTSEMMKDPDAFFDSQMAEMETQAEERRQRIDELLQSNEQEPTDSNSGRRYRIRGRSIRGILVLFGLIAAGFWKLVGGGNSNDPQRQPF